MDIRKYFDQTPRKKAKIEQQQSTTEIPLCEIGLKDCLMPSKGTKDSIIHPSTSSERLIEQIPHGDDKDIPSYDLGQYLDCSLSFISNDVKYQLLTKPQVKFFTHDFKKDALNFGKDKRQFQKNWLESYPWLVYSPSLKGGLCKYCVLFKPTLKRGVFGAFVVNAQKDFKHFHEDARAHAKSQFHQEAVNDAKNFCDSMEMKKKNVIEHLDSTIAEQIQINRTKLKSILKTIIFCGSHDISLRGKLSQSGNFEDLLRFRIDAGDKILEDHLRTRSGKSKYTSHRVQNDLINICGSIIQETIVKEANECEAFSLLADETADISGKEQMSLGIRYIKKDADDGCMTKEEFIGFVELEKLDAGSVADAILQFTEKLGLEMPKLIGLGFDGCSTMAGKESGVQQRIRAKYPKAVYFHCASHRLNLVVNDLNRVPEIRNTIGTIKQVIRFFRESTLRMKKIPNILSLCETRWSEKYKSIRYFSKHFLTIKEALSNLSTDDETNPETRAQAFMLDSATSSVVFIACLKIISRYSSYLEPVVNKLQSVDFDLHSVHRHINKELLEIFRKHRVESEEEFAEIFLELKETCDFLEIDMKMPRMSTRQTNRSNIPLATPLAYYRATLFIPYLDSLIMSLESRFTDLNETPFKAILIHPTMMKNTKKDAFIKAMKELSQFYEIENLEAEARTWYDFWKNKDCDEKVNLNDLLTETAFFPSVKKALLNYMTIPPTTCSVERSFSTLRRVKTWLRSTMSQERLSSLCLLSVHRDRIKELNLEELAINEFSKSKRNLKFAFSERY